MNPRHGQEMGNLILWVIAPSMVSTQCSTIQLRSWSILNYFRYCAHIDNKDWDLVSIHTTVLYIIICIRTSCIVVLSINVSSKFLTNHRQTGLFKDCNYILFCNCTCILKL